MKLNEVELSDLIGDVRAAQFKQGVGRLMGTPGSEMSSKDRMTKDRFIKNFMGRATHDIDSMINSGAVSATPVAEPAVAPAAQPAGPETPEQKRIRLQKAAQQQADLQGVPVAKPAAPPTPAQVRQQKQAQAAQTAQGQMAPVSKLPANQFAKTATTVRQQQQGQAAQTAQQQMNPASPLPQNQYAQSAANVRQQKQAQAAQAAQQQMARKPVAENSFEKLNNIFESIMTLDEQATPMSISDYLMDMVDQYTDVDMTKYHGHIKAIAKEVENTYSKGKARQALYKLGNLLYAISYAANPTRTGANTLAKAGAAQAKAQQAAQEPAEPEQGGWFGVGGSSVPAPTAQAPATGGTKFKAPQTPEEPVTIGGQKIDPSDPLYKKIMKKKQAEPAIAESKPYKKWGEK